VKIRAPAKINLSLRVVGERTDGYHLVDTVMVPVSLHDDILIHRRKKIGRKKGPEDHLTVTCDDPSVPQGRKNLAYKAASLLLQAKGIDEFVQIRIHKRIPVGAGLGGGSTDAAATLVGLNRLFRLGYTIKQLEKISATLGADVPFFIKGVPARARGIGERLTPLRAVPRFWCVIVYPNFPISTAWVYRNLGAKLTKPIVNTSINFSLGSSANLQRLLVNDLETTAMNRYPRIRSLKEGLALQGALGTLMSGSGSSVFGIFASKRRAGRAFRRLRKEREVQAFLVHVLN
jgi:4-diphosphocytidyl-2-C-methyl-D-erythritol kinase